MRLRLLGLLFFLVILWPSPSRAGIAYVSGASCASSNATSCTPAATVVGDLAIMFAFRSGSTTAPTCPTSPAVTCPTGTPYTGSGGSGGTSGSWRVGCFVWTATNQSSGTWTSAGNVVVITYSGTTGNCGTVFGGGADTVAASATLTYPAIALLTVRDSTSWVVGFGGSRTATNVACSSSLTNRQTSGTTAEVVGCDSNAGEATWSSSTVTVNTSTENVGISLEILAGCAATGWCYVQADDNTACSSASSTCAVTTAATGTGHLLVAIGFFNTTGSGNRVITGVSGGCSGSWVPDSGSFSFTSTFGLQNAYCLSSSSGATSITLTLTSSPGGTWLAAVREYSYTYASIAFDTSNQNPAATCTTCSGPALTIGGANDVIIQAANGGGTLSAVSSPYGHLNNINSGGAMSADALNTTTGTAVTWTQTSGTLPTNAEAFKQAATASCTPTMMTQGTSGCG